MEQEIEGLPLYIYQPTSAIVSPPVETLKQILPFEQLEWRNFERLCCRLIMELGDVKYSYLYGIPGQDQYGIDILAKRANQVKYSVYQCKNVKNFSGTELRNAIDKFLKNKWKDRTQEFTFCIAADYNKNEQLDTFEEQKTRLQSEGIKLEKWDTTELSGILKDKPSVMLIV